MRALALAVALAVPALLPAQQLTVRPGGGRGAALIDSVLAEPHVVVSGTGRLDLPRDSTVTSSLLVLGRPTYLASKVQGDVVVVGGDLFLRPGAEISGRAVAVGGTVVPTTLGHVRGESVSLRDESFNLIVEGPRMVLEPRSLRVTDSVSVPMFALGGLFGLGMPKYERVDGLSLPVSAVVSLAQGKIAVEPSATYRSRLGAIDPGVELRVGDTVGVQFVARAARDTRTNDGWIYRDLINSLLSLTVGTDARNYFRSDLAEARLQMARGAASAHLEGFVGGRYEGVRPVSGTGDVFSFFGRSSLEHMARPNPLVDDRHIGSALAGIAFKSSGGPIEGEAHADVEQAVSDSRGSNFTQLTLHGVIGFPTFGTQSLHFRAHGVATRGDSVPLARYAYLGGSGTLPLVELLDLGGTDLLYVESRYEIPFERVVLPFVGSPTLTLRHFVGGAGVGSLGEVQQEVGAGIGVGTRQVSLHLDYTVGAGGRSGHEVGVGLSVGL